MVRLFSSSTGRQLTNVSLDHYWAQLMKKVDTMGQPYFPPGDGRTQYVEYVTSATGLAPETWDGVAAILGNSVSQWKASYAPTLKRRIAQEAVHAHKVARGQQNRG